MRNQWAADSQEFPSLGTQKTTGKAKGSAGPSNTEMDRRPMGHPTPVSRNLDREMQPAKDIRSVPGGNRDARTRGVQEPIVTPLSPLAESFTPRPTSEERQTQPPHTDNDLDRSLAKTGLSEMETPRDSIKCKIATIGTACPIEIGKPVAMADVAEPRGLSGTGAGGPVVAGTRFTAVADRTGASGPRKSETGEPVMTGIRFQTGNDMAEASGPAVTGAGGSFGVGKGFRPVSGIAGAGGLAGAGGPVVAGTWFLAVADVYAPFEETEGDPQSDIRKFDQILETITEVTSSHPLGHAGVTGGTVVGEDPRRRNISENGAHDKDPDAIQGTLDTEQVGFPSVYRPPNGGSKPFDADGAEYTAEGDAIMVGVVGSTAPWFLTGWTNDVEVEFMIDTGCQVTILATSLFEKMCKIHPQVRTGLVPCAQRLVSADSSPLTVMGRINLNVVFPGLRCDMCCVVASIGSDGLLGMEALQSCLPHQLDLRTGQLWADGRSTLQLHQQKPTPKVSGSLITAVVLPPDSEVVANFLIDGGQLGTCALIDPNWDLTEEFGVGTYSSRCYDAVGERFNNKPQCRGSGVACGSHIGDLVPVLAVSVARLDVQLPIKMTTVLPDYLEDIVRGSHASLGDTGRQSLRKLLNRYEHVFPAPGNW